MTAFARARESSSNEVAATAGLNLGATLGQLDRSAEAVAVYDQVVDRFGEDPAPALREAVARAVSARQETEEGELNWVRLFSSEGCRRWLPC